MRTVLNGMKNQFSDFYFVSYDRLYLQFTIKIKTKKNLFNSGQIYRKDAHCSENDFLVHELFFFTTFSLWDMVDFDVCDFIYTKDLRGFFEPDSDANQWGI